MFLMAIALLHLFKCNCHKSDLNKRDTYIVIHKNAHDKGDIDLVYPKNKKSHRRYSIPHYYGMREFGLNNIESMISKPVVHPPRGFQYDPIERVLHGIRSGHNVYRHIIPTYATQTPSSWMIKGHRNDEQYPVYLIIRNVFPGIDKRIDIQYPTANQRILNSGRDLMHLKYPSWIGGAKIPSGNMFIQQQRLRNLPIHTLLTGNSITNGLRGNIMPQNYGPLLDGRATFLGSSDDLALRFLQQNSQIQKVSPGYTLQNPDRGYTMQKPDRGNTQTPDPSYMLQNQDQGYMMRNQANSYFNERLNNFKNKLLQKEILEHLRNIGMKSIIQNNGMNNLQNNAMNNFQDNSNQNYRNEGRNNFQNNHVNNIPFPLRNGNNLQFNQGNNLQPNDLERMITLHNNNVPDNGLSNIQTSLDNALLQNYNNLGKNNLGQSPNSNIPNNVQNANMQIGGNGNTNNFNQLQSPQYGNIRNVNDLNKDQGVAPNGGEYNPSNTHRKIDYPNTISHSYQPSRHFYQQPNSNYQEFPNKNFPHTENIHEDLTQRDVMQANRLDQARSDVEYSEALSRLSFDPQVSRMFTIPQSEKMSELDALSSHRSIDGSPNSLSRFNYIPRFSNTLFMHRNLIGRDRIGKKKDKVPNPVIDGSLKI